MTTIVAWTSFQNEKPSALTFASDSRLSWAPSESFWDFGRKIFWCKNSPDIFGFAGDMVTQSTTLSQVCELFDYELLAKPQQSANARHKYFVSLMTMVIAELNGVSIDVTQVLHGVREDQNGNPAFRLWRTTYDPNSKDWTDEEMKFNAEGKKNNLDDPSQFYGVGSGAAKHLNNWRKIELEGGKTSRAIFRALMDVIEQGEDTLTGGLPQVVSLGRDGLPKPVGVSIGGERSVCGMPLGSAAVGGIIEWRDENYVFLNPDSLVRYSKAQKHFFK